MLIRFIIIILVATNLSAQYKYDLRQFGDETSRFPELPLKWNAGDYAILAGISAGAYSLMFADDYVRKSAQDFRKKNDDMLLMKFGTYYGEPLTSALAGAAFIIHGISTGNDANKKLGYEISQAFVYSVTVTGLIKFSFGRARPFKNEGAFSFSPLSFRGTPYMSFSSGHTGLAFSLSTVLAENSDNTLLKIVYYIPAIITGISRIYHDRHWLSDVFFGAAAGYFIAKHVTLIHDDKITLINEPPAPLLRLNFPLN